MLTVDLDRLPLRPGARVLDLGCGDGRHSRATRRLPGVSCVALDSAPEEVRKTAESLRAMDGTDPGDGGSTADAGPWLAVCGSSYHLPFRAARFDCLIVSEVLEHLTDDDAALQEIGRVLHPQGHLVVSVPRFFPEAICWLLSREYRSTPGGHVRIYRRSTLERKLVAHGYRVLGRHHAHALHSPYWWLKCLFGPSNDSAAPVRLYHRILVWDMFQRPAVTRGLERLLNPLIGKSVVFYARKGGA